MGKEKEGRWPSNIRDHVVRVASAGLILFGTACDNVQFRRPSQHPDTGVVATSQPESQPEITHINPLEGEILYTLWLENIKIFNQSYDSRRRIFGQELTDFQAVGILKTGALIPQRSDYQKEPQEAFVRVEGNNIIFGKESFYPNSPDPTNFVFAAALTEALLRRLFGVISRDVFNDVWYLQNKVHFQRSENVSPFANTPEQLANLSKFLQGLEKTGMTKPENINLTLSNANLRGDQQLVFDLAQIYAEQNPNLVTSYQVALNRADQDPRKPLSDPKMVAWMIGGIYSTEKWDFKTALVSYIMYGDRFRNTIKYAELKGLKDEENILRTAYQSLQEFCKNREYQINGTVKPKEIYSPGMWVKISDWDKNRPGVLLRPKPQYGNIDPDWPAVNDQNTVKILDGPVFVLDEEFKEAREWYFVQDFSGNTGWIRVIGLGEPIKP